MVRVNWNTPGDTMRLLDAGAYGVICPMIETRTECEAFVGACRFPPLGYRSLGPTRARVYAGDDYAERANDTIITFAMIETEAGFNNREEIMSVPGLDGVFVGIGDLRLSLTGRAGADFPMTRLSTRRWTPFWRRRGRTIAKRAYSPPIPTTRLT